MQKALKHCINTWVLSWRRRRDSNSRNRFAVYAISSGEKPMFSCSSVFITVHGSAPKKPDCLCFRVSWVMALRPCSIRIRTKIRTVFWTLAIFIRTHFDAAPVFLCKFSCDYGNEFIWVHHCLSRQLRHNTSQSKKRQSSLFYTEYWSA